MIWQFGPKNWVAHPLGMGNQHKWVSNSIFEQTKIGKHQLSDLSSRHKVYQTNVDKHTMMMVSPAQFVTPHPTAQKKKEHGQH